MKKKEDLNYGSKGLEIMKEARHFPEQERKSLDFLDLEEWPDDERLRLSDWLFLTEEIQEKSGVESKMNDLMSSYEGKRDGLFNESRLDQRLFWLFIEYFFLSSRVPLKKLMDSVERNIIIRTLSKVNGNQKRASRVLGVKHTTLNEKIKKHKIHLSKRLVEFY
jgi:DNA-binding NtrC family response regulator